jgi:hypothetical protein
MMNATTTSELDLLRARMSGSVGATGKARRFIPLGLRIP